ncbi:DMT family transporter [Enterococcus hulanensis]|uniref:DMT family transporter n=1 Tax=Enterococcus hulanensis TaxID=2559929 RepID=A0ABU3ETW8_9ENTE|nr:DMT family transporter [Enterococcus hulanensis]MDT2598312.1 DMT family transporter [Enterococcus hulanensis]MDT2608183.1 DMT family transporter [Enterococcus hulanensis]MDT2615478.1 DMT family transporter [Enterococcus hulanensis]MDT2626551.1 DMT family transporter [Enterococcus hulanensis]MDT2654550.1 DMT family transporter [Enterococcus hulanensis]
MKKLNQRTNETKDVLIELVAVAFLATGGIFVKVSSLSPINTGFYRILFSIPFLLPLAYKQLRTLSKKDVCILGLAGIFLAGDIALWNLSFSYTSVANANLLTNLTPFTVIPVSYFLFKEKISKLFIVGAGITLLGVFILLGGKANPSSASYFGDLLAFCASIFYAGFLLISYRLRDHYQSSVIMFVSGFGSLITLGAASTVTEGFQIPNGLDEIAPLLGLAICLQVIGHNLLAHCQGKLNVNLSTIVCLCQPVIASIYSFFIFKESLSLKEAAGIAIVMLGVYSVKAQYKTKKVDLAEEQA